MHKLKTLAKRGSAFAGAVGLLAGIGTSALPAFASADALNPLTERSLTLSSSSPGWSYTDGSGNSTYAPPNSGANGQKTGNFFSFRTTSNGDSTAGGTAIKAFTLQYCTGAAGDCLAPGDNGWTGTSPSKTRNSDTTSTSDLNVVASSPTEITSSAWTTISARQSGVTPGLYAATPKADNSEGNFVVLVNGAVSSGWTFSTSKNKLETGTVGAGTATGKNNLITIENTTGADIPANAVVQLRFYATSSNYITNPGSGAFFVRINDYSDASDDTPTTSTHIIDGGVTVANVMNQSISIQTKVLETMEFSVGTFDPDNYNTATDTQFVTNTGLNSHGQCDPLLMKDPDSTSYSSLPDNVLKLGNDTQEFSLQTDRGYMQQSYLRLSSNSSGGATLYYTGHTLTNTEGDEIAPMQDATSDIGASNSGNGTQSHPGSEQFGLGIAANSDTDKTVFGDLSLWGNTTTAGDFAKTVNDSAGKAHLPSLAPLVPAANYGNAGAAADQGNGEPDPTSGFAFSKNADSDAVPIASENTAVVDCVTAKVRYIANIAATTPAGIYTTKINYVASPQY